MDDRQATRKISEEETGRQIIKREENVGGEYEEETAKQKEGEKVRKQYDADAPKEKETEGEKTIGKGVEGNTCKEVTEIDNNVSEEVAVLEEREEVGSKWQL